MACLNTTFDSDQGVYGSTARISFSNDFADCHINIDNSYRQSPVSSDFQFSVPNYPMKSADEIFFKGKILPLKKTTTLRDELRAGNENDDSCEDVTSPKYAKGTRRWKEMLGLKKAGKNITRALRTIDETKDPDPRL